jgi:hypothetical protein
LDCARTAVAAQITCSEQGIDDRRLRFRRIGGRGSGSQRHSDGSLAEPVAGEGLVKSTPESSMLLNLKKGERIILVDNNPNFAVSRS